MINIYKKIILFTLCGLITTSSIAHEHKKKPETPNNNQPMRDYGVINKDRIIYWLQKRGELAKDATEKEKLAAFNQYIKVNKTDPREYIYEIDGKPVINFSKPSTNKQKIGQQKGASAKQSSKVDAHNVNVLTLLIDFPDLPHDNNKLTANDTSMYYPQYTTEHYQELMFSPNTFTGPNGEPLMSAHQYYLHESGSSFKFNGKVFGWLTADHEAKYYGENNEYGNDKAATDLVKEALDKAVLAYDINLSDFDLIDPADLDGDGVISEPDGYIDYLMVFHSSVGADAGGGVLGDNAIWAHRWNINNYSIPNTNYDNIRNYLAHSYTIQGIDSAIGVVAHEFGHMVANLYDEYDTHNSVPNSPVAFWSIMAGGSWAGDTIPGAMPTGFSPLAKTQLQTAFGGNWHKTKTINLANIKEQELTIPLVAATTHSDANNLIDIKLPANNRFAIKPYAGDYQYYSGAGDNLSNVMSFNVDVPSNTDSTLTMKAHWDIEEHWDYAQIMIDGEPVTSNYSFADNKNTDIYQWYGLVENYLTGKSSHVKHGWVDLNVDISQYQGNSINVAIVYTTDSNTQGKGIFIDDIALTSPGKGNSIGDAEQENVLNLSGFTRINHFIESATPSQNYFIQLRNYNTVDAGLSKEYYDHGVVMWLADSHYSDNQVSLHPGHGFIGVIDADQNLIKDEQYGIWWTSGQVRDAAFSLYQQQEKMSDTHLEPISLFDDQLSYINALQPQSGMNVPIHGLKVEVVEQAEDSSETKVRLTAQQLELTANFALQKSHKNTVYLADTSFGESQWLTYEWDFGDDSPKSFVKSPVHTYQNSGQYQITQTITDDQGNISTTEKEVTTQGVSFMTEINFLQVAFINTSEWGDETLTFLWDFGDNEQSSEKSPNHIYKSAGNYTVTLTMTTESGETLVATQHLKIELAEPPKSSFITTIKHLKVHGINKTVQGAGKLIYSWDFGDGSGKKAGTSPTHVYKTSGEFTITLKSKDELGRESSYSQTVSVQNKPEPNAGSMFVLLWLITLTLILKFSLIDTLRCIHQQKLR